MREIIKPATHQATELCVASAGADLSDFLTDLHELNQTFVDTQLERSSGVHIKAFTRAATLLMNGQCSSHDAQLAAYEAFFFAYQVCNHVRDDSTSLMVNIDEYNNTILKAQLPQSRPHSIDEVYAIMRRALIADGTRYLESHPAINNLVWRHANDIDASSDHTEVIRTIAELTFLQIELGDEKLYVDEQIRQLEQ